jgi:hypothetical protein
VTISIGTNPGGGTLSGTLSQAAVGGVATFSDLKIDKAGTGYTLNATSGGLTGATSNAFTINSGTLSKLAFGVQPSDAAAGAAITPAVTVEIKDASGNRITTATNTVTISIGTNPGGGTLSGTLSKAAVAGVATFTDLYYNKAETITLSFSSSGLTGTNSGSIVVSAGAFEKLQVLLPGETAAPGTPAGKSGSASTQTAGNVFTATVNAVDANWNLVSTNDTVRLTSSDANAVLQGLTIQDTALNVNGNGGSAPENILGAPVLGGMEYLNDGVNCRVAEPRDFAAAVGELLQERSAVMRFRMRQAAIATARRYTTGRMMQRLSTLLDGPLSGWRRRI